jgi:hypothetical protein
MWAGTLNLDPGDYDMAISSELQVAERDAEIHRIATAIEAALAPVKRDKLWTLADALREMAKSKDEDVQRRIFVASYALEGASNYDMIDMLEEELYREERPKPPRPIDPELKAELDKLTERFCT